MSDFEIPTLEELTDGVVAQLDAKLPDANATDPNSQTNIEATVYAGEAYQHFVYQQYQFDQVFLQSASGKYLDSNWGYVYGIQRNQAAKASGNFTFSGTDSTTIPANTIINGSGGQYKTSADGEIASGFVTIEAVALAGGESYNAIAGITYQLDQAISGVDSVVGGEFSGGADLESDDDYRARLKERTSRTPRGGTAADFEFWAKEVDGVSHAWAYGNEQGAGTVVLRFLFDDEIPTQEVIDRVYDHIDSKRNITCEVFVVAPVEKLINIEISNLSPDTASVKATVEAELKDFFIRNGEPNSTIHLSQLYEAISGADGEISHKITSPTDDVAIAFNEIARLGIVSYV